MKKHLFAIAACVFIFSAGAKAADIFTDDFETGDLSNWSGVVLERGCTVYATNLRARSGNYSLRTTDTINITTEAVSCVYKNIAPQTFLYNRFYFYLPSGFYNTFQTGTAERMFFRLNGTGRFIECLIRKQGNSRYLRLQVDSSWANENFTNPAEQTWYCVEILAPAASSSASVRWWVNDTEQTPIPDNLSDAGTWNRINLGSVDAWQNLSSQTFFLDEFISADTYIGPIGADPTPPADIAYVYDGNAADVAYTYHNNNLSANWPPTTDLESGISRYWYAIGTTPGATNTAAWTDNSMSTWITRTSLALSEGVTYYFSVKADNTWGLQSGATNSDGQFIKRDATGPLDVSEVRDGTGSSDIDATFSFSQLSANWDPSADAESGVYRYWYAIGTTPGGTNIWPWTNNNANTSVTRTGLGLSAGPTYYFSVKAENYWGVQSNAVSSDGQMVTVNDVSVPVIGWVRDGLNETDATFTYEKDKLSAIWLTGNDPDSGISRYYYGIGTSAGATDVVAWTNNGISTSVSQNGLTLTAGVTYYFTLKAQNGVGLESTPVNTNGQFIREGRPNEYVWLHVDNEFIKRSPYSTDPNGIWMGCGVAYRGDNGQSAAGTFAIWAKSKGVNCVRISFGIFQEINYPTVDKVPQEVIDEHLDPLINALKAQGIYSILDYHEYMADYTMDENNFLPEGQAWAVDNPTRQCQRWLEDWKYLAYYYKDEPWVLGYELCNEPRDFGGSMSPGTTEAQCRKNYLRCLENIRKIDTKHILLLGSASFSAPHTLKTTWENNLSADLQYRPDAPYHQIVFAFHDYTLGEDIYLPHTTGAPLTAPEIARVQTTFKVPLYCTETGSEITTGNPSTSEIRRYQQEIIEVCYGQPNFWQNSSLSDKAYPANGVPQSVGKMGWSIWASRGNNSSSFQSNAQFSDIWPWAAAIQASSAPVDSGIIPSNNADHINCTTLPSNIYADGNSISVIQAIIVDSSNNRIMDYSGAVTFSLSGEGTWEDSTTSDKSVSAIAGISTMKVKSTTVSGIISVTVSAAGLTSGTASFSSLIGPSKVVLTASPEYLPSGVTQSFITGYIKDANNNTVTTATGTFHFTINGPGSIWLSDTIQSNERGVVELGKTYVIYKTTAATGTVVVTAIVEGLVSGSITLNLGESSPVNDVSTIRVYPNPLEIMEGATMKFDRVPSKSEIRIFALSGKLVRKLREADSGCNIITWDGKNTDGEFIAQGIYIYVIKDAGGKKKTGKVAIKRF